MARRRYRSPGLAAHTTPAAMHGPQSYSPAVHDGPSESPRTRARRWFAKAKAELMDPSAREDWGLSVELARNALDRALFWRERAKEI